MTERDGITIGTLETPCHIFEGDGTRPIHEDNVTIIYEPGPAA